MDEMQMIDRDKIESSAPYAIAWASSVPGDAQEDTSLLMKRFVPWLRFNLMVKE